MSRPVVHMLAYWSILGVLGISSPARSQSADEEAQPTENGGAAVDESTTPPAPPGGSQPERQEGGRGLDALGEFERRAVERVLRDRDWEIEPEPAAKTVAQIRVVTLPVFSPRDSDFLQWFNRFHATTRPHVVRREILLEEGDSWDEERIAETERNLRNPVFTSLAVALPIRTEDPETVDLLVVTRDIWSLRPGVNFEIQDGLLSELTLFLSENNLLGRHKSLNATFDMGLGSWEIGPQYYDPNLFGTHAELFTRVRTVFNRRTGEFEGTRSTTTIRYPLWNLSRTWGGELSFTHADDVVREFRGAEPLPYDDPRTAREESVPWKYNRARYFFKLLGRYATGESVEHRFTLGYRFQIRNSSLPEDFPDDPGLRRSFRRDVLPPTERNSGPFAAYYVFVPRWIDYRNIDTYELPEEEAIGPYARVEISPVLEAFGSLKSFLQTKGRAGWRFDIARDGYLWFEGGFRSRIWGDGFFDNDLYGALQVASPVAFDAVRGVARVRGDAYIEDSQNRIAVAGGQRGLRGYEIGAFTGTRRVLGNLELRTMPISLASYKLGALAFWDVGHAADQLSELRLRHDVGAGLRLVVPQVQTVPLRVDWAFPVEPGRAAWPGRLTIGFGQIF